jgi:hypothetical protein
MWLCIADLIAVHSPSEIDWEVHIGPATLFAVLTTALPLLALLVIKALAF